MPFVLSDRKRTRPNSLKARQTIAMGMKENVARKQAERKAQDVTKLCRHRDPRTDVRCTEDREGNSAFCKEHWK